MDIMTLLAAEKWRDEMLAVAEAANVKWLVELEGEELIAEHQLYRLRQESPPAAAQ